MPNTPVSVQQGASVFVPGDWVNDEDIATTVKLLASVGTCERVSEQLLDVVTALSGSGPAYVIRCSKMEDKERVVRYLLILYTTTHTSYRRST